MNCTCAQGEGVVPHFVKVAVYAIQAELSFISVITAALSVAAAGPVAVADPVSVTRSLRSSHAGFIKKKTITNTKTVDQLQRVPSAELWFIIGSFLTIAVRSKRSFWTAHFDGFNAEPFMQIRMFCFPALQQEIKQEEMKVSRLDLLKYTKRL